MPGISEGGFRRLALDTASVAEVPAVMKRGRLARIGASLEEVGAVPRSVIWSDMCCIMRMVC